MRPVLVRTWQSPGRLRFGLPARWCWDGLRFRFFDLQGGGSHNATGPADESANKQVPAGPKKHSRPGSSVA